MKSPILLSLTLGCGWLFSPEVLVITGNSAGHLGWLALPLLMLTALLVTVCNRNIHNAQQYAPHHNELSLLGQSIGKGAAATLTIASCLPLLILAATALLVTSGYSFNEVFLYWFPNFGFAFLLLGLLSFVQFLPLVQLQRIQLCFVSLAGLGIVILGVYGSLTPAKKLGIIVQQPEQLSAAPLSSALLLLLFAGSNLYHGKKDSFAAVPLIALLVFLPWMFASLAHVDPQRLADSTIPYMTVSRKILGDSGRQIMGIVVIMGSCAAFTGLSLLCREKLSDLSREKMAPPFLAQSGQRWLLPLLIAIATGICMATGLAGDELLETLLRSALLLWLLYYGVLSFSAALALHKELKTLPLPAYIAPLVLVAAFFYMVFSNPHTKEIPGVIIALLTASGCIAAVWLLIAPNRKDTL